MRPGGEDTTVALQADATFEEGVTHDLIALGRPDDQTLTLLTLMAPVAIQTGDVATRKPPPTTRQSPRRWCLRLLKTSRCRPPRRAKLSTG